MSFFVLKDRVDSALCSTFNVLSDVFFKLSFRARSKVSDNRYFKNIYCGKRCFIVGTGPSIASLSKKEVDFLKGEIVFGVNSFYKADCLDGVVPKFYALLDNNYLGVSKKSFQDVLEKYEECPPIFITDYRGLPILESLSRPCEKILIYAKNYPVNDMRYDLSGNMSISMNVVSCCIQSAMYMGFKEIYLLGCDYNAFCSSGAGHCYDDKDELSELPKYNLAFYLKYYHLTTVFHYMISSRARKDGVKVINLTNGSLLDAYPLKKLSELVSVTG